MIQDFLPAPKPSALRLVRSFDVPADDPAAPRMTNLSWTYDSALAAISLMFAGEKAQAEQLLDQLAALQRTDGSIDFAFNVADGSSLQQFRTGSIAWIGLAAATYGNLYRSSRYDALAGGAARWLLARKQSSGLLAGGPDVSWVSTQHNLLAWFFLSSVDDKVEHRRQALRARQGDERHRRRHRARADRPHRRGAQRVRAGRQGLGPPARRPGSRPALPRGLGSRQERQGHRPSPRSAAYLGSAFAVGGRSIVKSSDPKSFNQTYSATGPFTGYRPYAEGAGPDVLWAEGTAQVRFALKALGENTSVLEKSMSAWSAITKAGTLGADRAARVEDLNEYHVWPTSAAASWTLLGSVATPSIAF